MLQRKARDKVNSWVKVHRSLRAKDSDLPVPATSTRATSARILPIKSPLETNQALAQETSTQAMLVRTLPIKSQASARPLAHRTRHLDSRQLPRKHSQFLKLRLLKPDQ